MIGASDHLKEALQAEALAEERLRRARKLLAEARTVGNDLRAIQTRNHLAEAVEFQMRGKHGGFL